MIDDFSLSPPLVVVPRIDNAPVTLTRGRSASALLNRPPRTERQSLIRQSTQFAVRK